MVDMAHTHFMKLFLSDENVDPEEVVRLFPSKLTDDMNATLCASFIERRSQMCFPDWSPQSPWSEWFSNMFFSTKIGQC